MLKHHVINAVAVLSLSSFTGAALASETCTQEPRAKWLSEAAIASQLKAQGFDVTRTEAKRSCYEVKARDAQGRQVELYVDPATARIVKREDDRRS